MSVDATWSEVSFETQDSSGNPTGTFVGMIGRVIIGYNQINDPTICGLGQCCPLEGAVSTWLFGVAAVPQGCFAMNNNMFWDFPHEFLNDGTTNPNWNGCPGPGNATGFNTCGTSGTDTVTPGTGTSPCQCNLGELYKAIPNIDFSQTGPGAQWLIVYNTGGNGQIDGCVEILKIVDNQNDWDNGTITCPSAFMIDFPPGIPFPAGTTIQHDELQLMGINGSGYQLVETDCNTCVENLYGCLDQAAVNTYWDCNNIHIPTVYGQNPNLDSGCCIYPGCPDSTALNYDPANADGCGVWANGAWQSGGITDTSCCMYPGCKDSVSTPCDIMTPLPNGDPGPIGCVANHGLDCAGNPVIPATGGILVNPAFSSCFTNEIPPSPNNDCYYVGCTDPTASNHTPGANGCLYPIPDGTQCCEYFGCDDPSAPNYGESCHNPSIIYSPSQLTGPCTPDNCEDPPVVGCMDDGCCVDGTINLVDPTPTASCPNGTHLCPQQGSGISFNSNYPLGCTPGIDCIACEFDPLATVQGMPYANYCSCEGGWYCDYQSLSTANCGGNTGIPCCIDIYASPLSQPYNWADPFVFGPCGGNTGVPCTGPGSLQEQCEEMCTQEELEECAVFMNDRQGNVYFYGPPDTNPNSLTFLFHDDQFNENTLPGGQSLLGYSLGYQSGTGSWDIANAAVPGSGIPEHHKVWLYSCRVVDIDQTSGTYGQIILQGGVPKGIIREYDVSIDPFSIDPNGLAQPAGTINPVYNRDIDITDVCQNHGMDETDPWGNTYKSIGNALVAQDETTLIAVSDRAIRIDISGPVATAQELFMLPNQNFPSVAGNTPTDDPMTNNIDESQAESRGDVIIDTNTGNLTITYWYPPNTATGIVGKFSLGAGVGAQMGDSLGNPTTWYETISVDNSVTPSIFGLFRWDPLWYAVQATATGGLVYNYDNSTLTVSTPNIGTITTLPIDAGAPGNDIVGASQKDDCTPDDDPCCCDDPAAINYDPDCTNPDPILCPCFFPAEPRFGCLPRLTKEEFLMNVVQKPETYSDVFIERGKVSVFERPQRLAQVSTIGELELHGYGYYNILIQE